MRDELTPAPYPQLSDSYWKPIVDSILDAQRDNAQKRNDRPGSFLEGSEAPDAKRVEAILRRGRAE